MDGRTSHLLGLVILVRLAERTGFTSALLAHRRTLACSTDTSRRYRVTGRVDKPRFWRADLRRCSHEGPSGNILAPTEGLPTLIAQRRTSP